MLVIMQTYREATTSVVIVFLFIIPGVDTITNGAEANTQIFTILVVSAVLHMTTSRLYVACCVVGHVMVKFKWSSTVLCTQAIV